MTHASGADRAARAAGVITLELRVVFALHDLDLVAVDAERVRDDRRERRLVSVTLRLGDGIDVHDAFPIQHDLDLVLRRIARAGIFDDGRDADAAQLSG